MKAGDLAELGLRNLREAILRNSLTTLGVAVGVASLVAMLSLGVGLQQMASRRLAHSGLFDTVMVMPKRNRGFRPNADGPPSSKVGRPLDESARTQIAALPSVVEVYPQIRFITEIRFNNNPYMTTVAGISPLSKDSGSFDDLDGRFFSSAQADEAILQVEFAKELSSQPKDLIGKELSIRYAERQTMPPTSASRGSSERGSAGERDFDSSGGFSIVPKEKKLTVVGIVEGEPAAGYGGMGNGRVFIPVELAETLQAAQANDLSDILRGESAQPGYASLTARASSPSKVEELESSIKGMGFATFSLLDATKNLRIFFAIFDLLLGIFGSLALAVATLGIVNTLVMAILERRREIGVLKALGADDGDVRQLFFVEAGIMGLLGGVVGVGLGWFIDRAVTIGTNIYLKQQHLPSASVFSLPWWLVAGAISFAVVVSLIAGLYPASRAARLQPVEALRYE